MIFSQIHLCNVARRGVRVNEALPLGENVIAERFGKVTLIHTFTVDELIGSGSGIYRYKLAGGAAVERTADELEADRALISEPEQIETDSERIAELRIDVNALADRVTAIENV